MRYVAISIRGSHPALDSAAGGTVGALCLTDALLPAQEPMHDHLDLEAGSVGRVVEQAVRDTRIEDARPRLFP